MSANTFLYSKKLSVNLSIGTMPMLRPMKQNLSQAQYQAYIENYERYKDKVYTYLYYRTTQDALLAEDLAADTFLKAFNNYASFDGQKSFSAWIFTIARNTLWDHFRTHKPTDLLGEDDEVPVPADFLTALDQSFEKERVQTAINKLPLKQKEVLVLKYMQDWSNEEIAQAYGTTDNNVRQKVHYAKQKLKNLLSFIFIFIGS